MAAAAEGRKKLADVTPASWAGWDAFAKRYDTNPTALAEVLGLYFLELGDGHPTPTMERLARRAAELTEERKRRPR